LILESRRHSSSRYNLNCCRHLLLVYFSIDLERGEEEAEEEEEEEEECCCHCQWQ
jgi:hypothetical protein